MGMPTYGVCRGKAQRAQQRRPDLHHLFLNRSFVVDGRLNAMMLAEEHRGLG
jgi:hypothetical protein